jgi:mxaD protein
MRRFARCLLVGTLSIAGVAAVATAADLSVKKTASFKGSPEATWSMIADYCGIQKWHPAIAKCDVVGGTANKVGAVRLLTLGAGGTVREELLKHDPKARVLTYRITESPLAIENYVATMTVLPGQGGGSIIEWTSTFKAAAADEAAMRSAIEGIYDAGLQSLQAKEAGQ